MKRLFYSAALLLALLATSCGDANQKISALPQIDVVKNHPQVINALVKTLHQEYPLSTVPQKISVREKLKVKPKKIRRIVRRISSNDQER